MQEIFIFIGIIAALFFVIQSHTSRGTAYLPIAACILLILGLAVNQTGWERFEGKTIIHKQGNDINVTTENTTYPAQLTANERGLVFMFSIFCIIGSLLIVFKSFEEYKKNKLARSE